LASFGASLQNSAEADMQNNRIKERQAAESALIAGREKDRFQREQVANLTQGLREGKILPGQLTDNEIDSVGGDVLKLTPPDQILNKPIFENLAKITKAGEVPGTEEIYRQRLSQGPIKDLSSLTSLLTAGQQQKTRLENSEAFDRDAAMAQKFGDQYNIEMAKNAAANATLPDALRRRESEGKVDVKLAGQKSYAQESGSIKAKIDNAAAILKMEGDSARQKAAIETDSRRGIARMEAVSKAEQAGATALPQLGNLYKLYNNAKDDLAKASKLFGPAVVDGWIGTTYVGVPTSIRLYYQELEKSLPFLARLTGEVGNLAEQEQVRQRFGLPTAYDAVQGTGEDKLETALALAMKASKLAELNTDPAILQLSPADRLAALDHLISQAKESLKTQRPTDDAQERQQLLQLLGR
jgi:hypothetical protein